MTLKEYKQIIKALEALDIAETARIHIGHESAGHVKIFVNGEEFGIYDLHRDTFVD